MNWIKETVQQIAGLAPVPAHFPRLMQLLQNPNASLADLEAIIQCDTALTASVLKWCNSVVCRGSEPVDDVQEAILRLGLNAVVELLLTLMSKKLYALPPEAGTHLHGIWDHCLMVGILTRKIARKRGQLAESAYTAGLLHDIGKILLIKAAPHDYSRLIERAIHRHKSCVDQEEEEWGFNHAIIGAESLARWNIPATIVRPIWFHHHPGLTSDEDPIASCIELANSISYALGYGMPDQYARHRNSVNLMNELSLNPLDMAEVIREAVVEMMDLKLSLFSTSLTARIA